MISIWTKNDLPGIAVGVIASFSIGMIGATPAGVYDPWSLATLIVYKVFEQLESVDLFPAFVSLIFMLIIRLGEVGRKMCRAILKFGTDVEKRL